MMLKLAWIAVALTACGSNAATTNPDAHVTKDSSANIDSSVEACTTYTTSSIASMRMGTMTGCFTLTNVVSIGTLSSATTPKLFVQDAGGGDFSAMLTTCLTGSTTHPCSVGTTVGGIADSESVTVKGTYIKSSGSTFEEFLIDSITDNGPGTAPAFATATIAQLERSGTATNLRFQHVTTSITVANELQMYDWTPSEFANTSATTCAYQYGFGMIPKTVSVTKGAACTNGTTQPAGQTTPNAAEVLIGTDFYKGFTVSSDCRCALHYQDMEPTATSTLSGTIGGLLVFEVPFGGSTGYYYLDPKVASDAPITATVAGM